MTRIASADRYVPRTWSITFGRVGASSAASAGPKHSDKASQRNISEDLECGCFGLAGQHVSHANLPTSRRIVDGDGNYFRCVAFRRQHVAGVPGDRLAGWIHYVETKDVIRGRSCRGKAQANRRAFAALYTRRRG